MGALLGLIFGSFAATLILRWPLGRSIAHGRSACDHCGVALSVRDLVPLLSYALSRGRCRACGGAIDRLHPATEALFAIIGAGALGLAPHAGGLALALLGWQVAVLMLLDARHQWLPHRLSALLALTGLAFGGTAMQAIGIDAPFDQRLIGGVVGFVALWSIGALYAALRHRQGLGGGDPPMLGALGAWCGWMALPFVLLFASVAGIAVAAVLMARRRPLHRIAVTRLPLGTLMALALPFALAVLAR